MRVSAIVLAAGKGLRFKPGVPKPLALIGSKPAVIHCLLAFERSKAVSEIIVVVNPVTRPGIERAIRRFGIRKAGRIVLGGRRRQDSVRCGLAALGKQKSAGDLVLIHDAARPFIDKRTLALLLLKAKRIGAAVPAVPVKSTVKRGARSKTGVLVAETVNRKDLWEIQTPQAFRRGLIEKAHARFKDMNVTDDAMLVERTGARVAIVPGSYTNIKITTPEDLVFAKAIAKKA